MKKQATYYLGRIIKRGILDTDGLIQAILKPAEIRRQSAWTFIDTQAFKDETDHFVFGKLSKYSPDAEVTVIDPEKLEEFKQPLHNLKKANSPFVYIPAHSGIAFMSVPNEIEPKTFTQMFCEIIKKTHHDFFVDCKIEMITDLRKFATKLEKLDGIYGIAATVSPPNPLFGPCWKELEEYLRSRNTDKMIIQEEGKEDVPIKSDLPHYVREMADLKADDVLKLGTTPKIGDAAILMAADGYGSGRVKGKIDEKFIIIRTSETIRNFQFDKIPEPRELYLTALLIFDMIKDDRHMEPK
jgi:hypothetical protein